MARRKRRRPRKLSKLKKLGLFLACTLVTLFMTKFAGMGIIPLDWLPDILQQYYEEPYRDGEYMVDRVVDGDTIVVLVGGKKERVRLIGVDTPESVHPDKSRNTNEGIIASDYTKHRLEGKRVRLETDVKERDRYGRILAYVYVGDEMINRTLLEEGYAKLMTIPPNVKYAEEFKRIVDERGTILN